jgi:F-type H+-transporting ATPase subunit delta
MNNHEMSAALGHTYAGTVFDLACQWQMLNEVKLDMDTLAYLLKVEKDFTALMASPYFSPAYKQHLIQKLFAGKFTDLTMNFLMVVIRHNRSKFLPQVIAAFKDLWNIHLGLAPVRVTVSHALPEDEAQKLSEELTAGLKSKIKLDMAVDPSIIGGVVIRYGDSIVDNSVRTRLYRAVKAITSQEKRWNKIDEV